MQARICSVLGGGVLLLMSAWANAAEDTSKQVELLNSQLKVQLQQMQEAQEKQIETLNQSLQKQLQTMHADLQDQMQQAYTKNQKKIDALQASLEAQIKVLQDEVLTGGAASKAVTEATPPTSNTSPDVSPDTTKSPVGIQ